MELIIYLCITSSISLIPVSYFEQTSIPTRTCATGPRAQPNIPAGTCATRPGPGEGREGQSSQAQGANGPLPSYVEYTLVLFSISEPSNIRRQPRTQQPSNTRICHELVSAITLCTTTRLVSDFSASTVGLPLHRCARLRVRPSGTSSRHHRKASSRSPAGHVRIGRGRRVGNDVFQASSREAAATRYESLPVIPNHVHSRRYPTFM